jgi:cell fate regulator YaaT (PSP1 superfamily)
MHCGGSASAAERCGNGLENIYPTTAVRYGRMRYIGEFTHPPTLQFTCGGKVVISTERGIEIGQQVSLTCFGCERSITREQIKAYVDASGPESFRFKAGRILREATEADLTEWGHIETACHDKLKSAREVSARLGLPMKIVQCEHTFGGERVVFYFMAEERIDFRQLVQTLAAEYQTRIEMRQVGARDDARLVGDYEFCGRECCCKNFLKALKPVGMAMAKLQKTTLDLSKVSGRCGRLKCCLRFEHETYEVLDKKVPRMNSRIRTTQGTGQVVERQVLTQLVRIRQDDGVMLVVPVEEIEETGLPPAPRPDPNANGGGNGREPRGRNARPQRPPPPRPRPAPKPFGPEEDDFAADLPEDAPAPIEPQAASEVVEERAAPAESAPQPAGPTDRPSDGAPAGQPSDVGPDGGPDSERRRPRRGRRRRRRGPRGEGGAPPTGPSGPS